VSEHPDAGVLLRQYASWELGGDGYPPEWHRPSLLSKTGIRYTGTTAKLVFPENVISAAPAIKDLIRERDEHRCLRCRHPYRGGGEWSPCNEECEHAGPYRIRTAAEPEWRTYAGQGLPFPGEAMFDWGPEGQRIHRWEYEAHWRILTVHHLDEDKANCRWWNLVSLCQRCHLRMQRAVVMGRAYSYEHSDWFKPFAAGFYALKYEDAELTREEVDARMDELLAYEHRFTQETLL